MPCGSVGTDEFRGPASKLSKQFQVKALAGRSQRPEENCGRRQRHKQQDDGQPSEANGTQIMRNRNEWHQAHLLLS
jgi:hypothetical protein